VQDAQALVCSWRWRATCSSMPCWTWSPATTATRQGMTARRVAVRRPVQQGHLPQNGTRPDLGHRPAVTQHQQHPVEQQEQPAARRPCSTRSSPAWSRTNRGWEPTITAKVSPLGYLAVYVLALAPRHVRSRRRPDRDPRESAEALLGQLDQLCGTEAMAQLTAPSRADDERFGRWFAKLLRSTASPRAAQAFLRVMLEIDTRPLLPLIHAPTLVLHRTGNPLAPIEHGHYLAERIPDAKLIELPGSEGPLPWQTDIAPDHIEEFLGSLRRPPAPPGCWRPCCLPTSSRPPARPAGSRIGAGVSCWTCTTSWPAGSSRSSRAAHQDDR
jgi:pimeloyl-ACP methyl ester carboxylesterase